MKRAAWNASRRILDIEKSGGVKSFFEKYLAKAVDNLLGNGRSLAEC